MQICTLAGITVVPVISLGLGFFLVKKPGLAIKYQMWFYSKINWKIEPVSMEKEMRNTRLMGVFLIAVTLLVSVYLVCGGKILPCAAWLTGGGG